MAGSGVSRPEPNAAPAARSPGGLTGTPAIRRRGQRQPGRRSRRPPGWPAAAPWCRPPAPISSATGRPSAISYTPAGAPAPPIVTSADPAASGVPTAGKPVRSIPGDQRDVGQRLHVVHQGGPPAHTPLGRARRPRTWARPGRRTSSSPAPIPRWPRTRAGGSRLPGPGPGQPGPLPLGHRGQQRSSQLRDRPPPGLTAGCRRPPAGSAIPSSTRCGDWRSRIVCSRLGGLGLGPGGGSTTGVLPRRRPRPGRQAGRRGHGAHLARGREARPAAPPASPARSMLAISGPGWPAPEGARARCRCAGQIRRAGRA